MMKNCLLKKIAVNSGGSEREERAMLIDNLEKVNKIIRALTFFVPFVVSFEERAWQHLIATGKIPADAENKLGSVEISF
jgi:hypothetical protein